MEEENDLTLTWEEESDVESCEDEPDGRTRGHISIPRGASRSPRVRFREDCMLGKMGELNPIVFNDYKVKIAPMKNLELGGNEESCLFHLVREVIRNGFEDDLLCKLPCPRNIRNINAITSEECELLPIMQVVREKMMHPTHDKMGKPLSNYPEAMLALILYTGGHCNYELCRTQREGDFGTWKFFDSSLSQASKTLRIYRYTSKNRYHNTGIRKYLWTPPSCLEYFFFRRMKNLIIHYFADLATSVSKTPSFTMLNLQLT